MAEPPWSPADLDAMRPRAKAHLRKRMRQLRGSLPPDARRRRSEAITTAVAALDAWRDARGVALYASLDDEFDTAALVADARARGVDVALPVVDGDAGLVFRWIVRDGSVFATQRSAWGLDEPTADAPLADLDAVGLVLVPALAVDPRGYRIGYGRAYYDRALPLFPNARRVAAVFAFQVIAEVPNEAHDQRVDTIVTDEHTYTTETP